MFLLWTFTVTGNYQLSFQPRIIVTKKGIRLYMVIGNFSEENPRSYNIMLRAGMNGVFQELSVEDIFV